MYPVIVGSRAAQCHWLDFRDARDYDLIATQDWLDSFLAQPGVEVIKGAPGAGKWMLRKEGVSIEVEVVKEGGSSKLIYDGQGNPPEQELYQTVWVQFLGARVAIAPPGLLYAMKRSHVVFKVHWKKNMQDFLFMRRKDAHKDFHKYKHIHDLRFAETQNRVQDKGMDMDMSNSEFFSKSQAALKRKYAHDDLHLWTCFGDRPLFESIKDDLDKAAISQDKFLALDHDTKIKVVQEECFALTLERYIIPAIDKGLGYDAFSSYVKTAGRLVNHFLPIWERHFAADNFLEICDYKMDFVAKFLNKAVDTAGTHPV